MFRVGQKVVCVDDSGMVRPFGEAVPQLGRVYTIRAFHEDGDAIVLTEIRNKPHKYADFPLPRECHFLLWRFRPVVDISDLEAIVREQMLGKTRYIAPDKFDRQRIHSAASPVQRDAMSRRDWQIGYRQEVE